MRMKTRFTRFLTLLLCLLLLGTAAAPAAVAADDPFRVVISMEGLTLGQGFYVEPTSYNIDQINDLLAPQGYGPYTKRNLTAGMATLAMLRDKNLTASITGRMDASQQVMYLKGVAGIDKGTVQIPAIITQNGGPSNSTVQKNADRSLDEFDYTDQSGWMITVNDYLITDNIAKFGLEVNNTPRNAGFQDYGNTYVIRWQFTISGYGRDLGYSAKDAITGKAVNGYFNHANKDRLYAAYAQSTDSGKRAEARRVMENLTATQSQVDSALTALTTQASAPADTGKMSFFQRIADFFRRIFAFFKNLF